MGEASAQNTGKYGVPHKFYFVAILPNRLSILFSHILEGSSLMAPVKVLSWGTS